MRLFFAVPFAVMSLFRRCSAAVFLLFFRAAERAKTLGISIC
jgi:hypothetical protein